MTTLRTYNVLIIGRSGSGKSATTKLLTSNPEIKVANSLKEVTTEVNFYDGTAFEVAGQFVRFRILDIPGLDKINNRADIREKILAKLEEHEISLNAIIYVSSLTERDTIDENKLFGFLQQLPWKQQIKKQALIPIFTKYDNLFIDAHEDDILQTKRQYKDIFEKLHYQIAWSKRIYWINQTKSLDFKLKCYSDLKEKYDSQIERLVTMIKKNKYVLTAKDIRELIEQEDKFILKRLFSHFEKNQVNYKKDKKSHTVILKVVVQPQTFEQSMAAVSASSIGIFISKVCQKEIPIGFSVILMSVPITIALLKLASDWFVYHDKKVGQNASGEWIMRSYEHICQEINAEMERQWEQFNNQLEFAVIQKSLHCRVPIKTYKFFDSSSLNLRYQEHIFQRSKTETHIDFIMPIPKFQQQLVWNPEIVIEYQIKRFDEEHVLKQVEHLRKEFCSNI